MPAYNIPDINKTADLVAQSPDFLPRLWQKGVQISEQSENFFSEFEGSSENYPIHSVTDLAKGAGQKIFFRTMAGLYGDGVIGDEIIGDAAEEWRVGQYALEVDYLRHATSHNLRTEDQTALAAEIKNGIPMQLGKWLGRKKTERLMMMFNTKGGSTNYLYANRKANREALRSADTIDMDMIITVGQQLKTGGAKPALVGKAGSNKIHRFIFVGLGEGLVVLQNSSEYLSALQNAGVRGDQNYIFKGGFADVNGHVIKEFCPVDHDGFGAIGSPLNPKALLGEEITAGTAAFDIKGGGSAIAAAKTAPKYFEFFSNAPYRFTPADTIAADVTTPRYVLIYNLTGADAGKMGFYSYQVNNGNKLTITGRLGSAVGGVRNTTIGNVTWDTGVWAGKHTDAHPIGSVVIETNSYGVPIGKAYMLGAMAAVRGYGRFQNKRTEQKDDGEFICTTYVTSIFGQSPVLRTDGRAPNFAVVEHALQYAGLSIPTVS